MPNCKQCQSPFEITPEDLAFYDRVSPVFDGKKYLIPPPTLCPECRLKLKMARRNEHKLYRRTCGLCSKGILSNFAPDSPFEKAYCNACYYSDRWNPMEYGRDFDFDKPFFGQFHEFSKKVPILALLTFENENCEYTHFTSYNKNCYLIFCASNCENCFYGDNLTGIKDSSDILQGYDLELCYECVECHKGYRLFYSEKCQNCSESKFLYNCVSCSNCLGCVNLTNQQYHILNKPVSKEEYLKEAEMILNDRSYRQKFKEKFLNLKLKSPHKYYGGMGNENVSGDNIIHSKNVHASYNIYQMENSRYCVRMQNSKDCFDCYNWGAASELGLENHNCGDRFYNLLFSEYCCQGVSNLMYCQWCMKNSGHLFACVGLQQKHYCVFNKQYTVEEYKKIVPRIIEHMQKTGEWGQFFQISSSPFAYNETVAHELYPLTREEASGLGYRWNEEIRSQNNESNPVPEKIGDVSDEILGKILTCDSCKKGYKIIAKELELYRKLGIPAPIQCYDCRRTARQAQVNRFHLWNRTCAKCGTPIQTTYAPDRPEIVYCEDCYLKEVY